MGVREILRLDEWKASKINPLFAGACLAALQAWNGEITVWSVLVFMWVIFLNASFGYSINNLSDRHVDRIAGKSNPFSSMSFGTALSIVLSTLVVGVGSAVVGFWGRPDVIVIAIASFALAAAYSVPPLRLKERGLVGLAASSLAQRVVPLVLVFQLLGAWTPATLIYLCLAFLIGVRFMLIHQVDDFENDVRSGVDTFITSRGRSVAERLLLGAVLPLEFLALCGLILAIAFISPAGGLVLGASVLCYLGIQVARSPFREAYRDVGESYLGFNVVYAIALPFVLACLVVARDPAAWPLAVLALLLVLADVLRMIRGLRELVRQVRQRLGGQRGEELTRRPPTFTWPIGIALFNRPEYAQQFLESLVAQELAVDSSRVIIHIDGYAKSRDEARALPDRTHEVRELAHHYFPDAEIRVSSCNVGIARAHAVLEEVVFAHHESEWGMFFEEDFVLHPLYLSTIEAMIRHCQAHEDIAMISATGDSAENAENSENSERPLVAMLHLWAFALRRTHAIERVPIVAGYLDATSGAPYWQRDDSVVWHACASHGVFPMGSSQDYLKRAALRAFNRIGLTTRQPMGFYVGENGEHFTPQAFREMGYDVRPEILVTVPSLDIIDKGTPAGTEFEGESMSDVIARAKTSFDIAMAQEGARNIIDPLVTNREITHAPTRWRVVGDERYLEGPFPELGLLRPFVWLVDSDSQVVIEVNRSSRYRVDLIVANAHENQVATLTCGSDTSTTSVPVAWQQSPTRLSLDCELSAGENIVTVAYTQQRSTDGDSRKLGLMLLDVTI